MKQFLFFCSILFALTSCQEEIGKIDLTDNPKKEIKLTLKEYEEVTLFTRIDIEYKKEPLFVYDFEFYQDTTLLLKGGTDPLKPIKKENEEKIKEGDITHWKFYGQLEGTFLPKTAGDYTFKVNFIRNNTSDLKINKAEVIFIK